MSRFVMLYFLLFITINLKGQQSTQSSKSTLEISCDRKNVYPLDIQYNFQYYGWYLVFEDHFNNPTLDLSVWDTVCGVPRDIYQERTNQWFTSENIEIQDSWLELWTKEVPPFIGTYTVWDPDLGHDTTISTVFTLTSEEIRTKYYLGPGIYHARTQLPCGSIFWPSLWTWGISNTFCTGEFDIFEFEGSTIYHNTNLHHKHIQDTNCLKKYRKFDLTDFCSEPSVFSFHLVNFQLKWFSGNDLYVPLQRFEALYINLNTAEICECNDYLPGPDIYGQLKAYSFNEGQNLIFGLGCIKDEPTSSLPQPLKMDYIRYYRRLPCLGNFYATSISSLGIREKFLNQIRAVSLDISGNITLEGNTSLEIIVSDYIKIQQNFKVNSGFRFKASISQEACMPDMEDGDLNLAVSNIECSDSLILSSKEGELNEHSNNLIGEIFPNPNNGYFQVKFNSNSFFEVKIFNSYGQEIYFKKDVLLSTKIDIRNEKPGIYMISISSLTNKAPLNLKLIKL